MSIGGNVDLEVMAPLAQLGQLTYGRVGETFKLLRPKLKKGLENARNESKGS